MEDSIGENAADTVPRKTRFRLTQAVIPGSLPFDIAICSPEIPLLLRRLRDTNTYRSISIGYRFVRCLAGGPLTVVRMLVAESGVLLGTSAWHSPSACSASRACSRRGSPPRFQLAPTVALRE